MKAAAANVTFRSGKGGFRCETLSFQPVWRSGRRGWFCREGGRSLLGAVLLLWLSLGFSCLNAAKVGDSGELSVKSQALRFITLKDTAVQHAVLGAVFVGMSCGLLGSFLVVRKMALTGDVISHAVLPGVALGYLWHLSKSPPYPIFLGAVAAGLLGMACVRVLLRTTRLKEDAVLGMVLSVFFAAGVCLLTMIQKLPSGSKSGIDKFLFGQAAAISSSDLWLMGLVAIAASILVVVFFKELQVSSFDASFSRTLGLRSGWIEGAFLLVLASGIVVALQAVGVVLVSAMLITPASAAYMLTDRLHRMVVLAMVFGILSGLAGAFVSFLGSNLPTGPFMVLGASVIFAFSIGFAPRHGIILRWWRQRSRARRIGLENTLKSIYHVLESRDFQSQGVSALELALRRKETVDEIRIRIRELVRDHMVTTNEDREVAFLTPEGWQRACTIVRNHRLWELYLTNAAQVPADHVHDDAENIEHVLGEDTVRELERKLSFATLDPHGRIIPGFQQIEKGTAAALPKTRPTGFGG